MPRNKAEMRVTAVRFIRMKLTELRSNNIYGTIAGNHGKAIGSIQQASMLGLISADETLKLIDLARNAAKHSVDDLIAAQEDR